MRVKSNYKKHAFAPILNISFAVHAAAFGISGLLPPAPEYAVATAPASMEVVMLETPQVKEVKEKISSQILTAESSSVAVREQPDEQESVKKEQKKEHEKPAVLSPPQKGAREESKPEYLQNPAPVYPRLAKQRGWEGRVLLRVYVDQRGNAQTVQIKSSSGYRTLDQAAVKAVGNWKFKPAHVGAMPIAVWMEIPVDFVLKQ